MKYILVIGILGLTFLLSSCQKELTYNVEPGTNDSTNTTGGGTDTTGGNGTDTTTTNSDYTFYYDAMIDGTHYVQGVTDDNGYEAGSTLGGDDDVVIGAGINPSGGTVTGKTGMGVSKGTMHNYITASNADFKNFFAPGDYSFSAGAKDGVSVGWVDENGTDWESDKGSGDQTGSNFKIVSVEDYQDIIDYYIKVKVQFNCKVYDDSGHTKTITNATFVGSFGKI